jgi:hypothetical protein
MQKHLTGLESSVEERSERSDAGCQEDKEADNTDEILHALRGAA